jgi:hypothetical protein
MNPIKSNLNDVNKKQQKTSNKQNEDKNEQMKIICQCFVLLLIQSIQKVVTSIHLTSLDTKCPEPEHSNLDTKCPEPEYSKLEDIKSNYQEFYQESIKECYTDFINSQPAHPKLEDIEISQELHQKSIEEYYEECHIDVTNLSNENIKSADQQETK